MYPNIDASLYTQIVYAKLVLSSYYKMLNSYSGLLTQFYFKDYSLQI